MHAISRKTVVSFLNLLADVGDIELLTQIAYNHGIIAE